LPLGLCHRAGRLVNEDGGGGQFMNLPQPFVAQLDGSGAIIVMKQRLEPVGGRGCSGSPP
jgi:hypothetical protein